MRLQFFKLSNFFFLPFNLRFKLILTKTQIKIDLILFFLYTLYNSYMKPAQIDATPTHYV